MPIKKSIVKLTTIRGSLNRIAARALREEKDYVFYLIKETQLAIGRDSSDTIVGRYSASTEVWAADPFNQPRKDKDPGSPYNFEWFGGFIDGIDLKIVQGGFDLFSRDGKASMLEELYGDRAKLLKLTEKNNKIINEEVIIPALYKDVIKALPLY